MARGARTARRCRAFGNLAARSKRGMEYETVAYRFIRDDTLSPGMEEEMRRVALLSGMLGLMVLGLAATPAAAHDGWSGYGYGYNGWREQAWREHEWREQAWREQEWRGHHHFW